MNRSSTIKKGFTLVETLVAISILMLAILGPLSIASAGLRNSIYARDQITAYYLAQEGIEYARYVRDDNYIKSIDDSGVGWLDGLEDCMIGAAGQYGCAIDAGGWFSGVTSPVAVCDASDCGETADLLYLTGSADSGYYTHVSSGNFPSRYTRIITIQEVSGSEDNEVEVSSTITWQSGLGQKTFTLTEHIFNIYETL